MAQNLNIRHISQSGEVNVYEVKSGGVLRVGRSSRNEISIPDELLSRMHFTFASDKTTGQLSVSDNDSANGTFVNGEKLEGNLFRVLNAGDAVEAGEQKFEIFDPASKDVDLGFGLKKSKPAADLSGVEVDLGLRNGKEQNEELSGGDEVETKLQSRRIKLILLVILIFAAALTALLPAISDFLASFVDGSRKETVEPVKQSEEKILSLEYEKVNATQKGIFRYVMYYDGYTAELSVRYDDMPVNNRKIRKGAKLSPAAVAQLDEICRKHSAFFSLGEDYSGQDVETDGELSLRRIRVAKGLKIKDVKITNMEEPSEFRDFREAIETFSRNELGVWAIQYSRDKLVELALEQERIGDAKSEERDVHFGNLFAALRAYKEACFYLESVNPKPDGYTQLVEKLSSVQNEHTSRYNEVRFLADKAINMQNWEDARRQLSVLCQIVPDKTDERNREARAKLVDVEKRLDDGGVR